MEKLTFSNNKIAEFLKRNNTMRSNFLFENLRKWDQGQFDFILKKWHFRGNCLIDDPPPIFSTKILRSEMFDRRPPHWLASTPGTALYYAEDSFL